MMNMGHTYQCLLWKVRFLFILTYWSYYSLAFFVVIISLNKLMKNTITVNVNHKLANLLLQLPLQKLTVAYGFLLQLINK